MRLTQNILRKLIKEQISKYLSEATSKEIKTNAIDQIATILTQIENEQLNPEEVINQAKAQFRKATQVSQRLKGLDSDPLGEVYSEKQRRWACAQDDPEFDEMCSDTAISKKKKNK
jgi:hypothetical protein